MENLKNKFFIVLSFLSLLYFNNSSANGIDDLCDVEGYTLIECTSIDGEFEGEDGDVIKLDNGNVFELNSYAYNYAYSPDAFLFGRLYEHDGIEYVFYKLIVEEEVYDVTKLK